MPFVADPIADPGAASPTAPSGFVPDPPKGQGQQPDTALANKQFARAASDSIRWSSGDAGEDVKQGVAGAFADFRGKFEAAANAGTGLVTGFPAYLLGGLRGLAERHLLGLDVDPKETAEVSQALATYQPKGAEGLKMAGQLMYPLQKVSEGAEWAGHKVADVTGSAGAGAITDATLQMLPSILLGEFGRKMGGQTVTADDMTNVAKVVAGADATPSAVAATETSLRAIHDKTGIGPFTIADAVKTDPQLKAQLMDPAVEIPTKLEPFLEQPKADVPVPGDGQPLLDLSPTEEEAVEPPGMAREHMVDQAAGGPRVEEVPLGKIKLSDDVPQFKADADEKGVVEPLGGKFDRTGVAPVQLWQRSNGDLEMISGRHRLDLAQRSGEETIPSQIHYEDQGFDVRKAATLDAELNIRDGQGKVKDYVDYFRGTEISKAEAEQRGLLARSIGRRAFAIASDGSPELVASHRAGQLSDDAAVAIAGAAPGDARLQAVGIRAVQDGKTIGQAANTVRAVKLLSGPADSTGDMFRFDDSAMREAEQMAKIATAKQRELQSRISAISGAAKRPELAAQEGINVKDSAAVLKRVDELKAEKGAWDSWSTNPDLVGQIRDELDPATKATPEQEQRITKLVEAARSKQSVDTLAPEVRAAGNELIEPRRAEAEAAKPAFDAQVQAFSEAVGGEAKLAPVKGAMRAVEKMAADAASEGRDMDPDDIKDLLRATTALEHYGSVRDALAQLGQHFDVFRVKDRLDTPTPAGYRDVLTNVRLPNGRLAELQLNTKAMLAAKDEAHVLYEIERALPADDPLVPILQARQRKIYGAADLASREATKASGSDTGKPSQDGQGSLIEAPDPAQTFSPEGSSTAIRSETSKNFEPSGKRDLIDTGTSEPIVGREQPSSAPARPVSDIAQAGGNPLAALADFRDDYSHYVGVEADHAVKPPAVDSQGKPISRFGDDLRRVLAPASRGELAAKQAGIMRANFGEMAHEAAMAETRLFDYAKTFDQMPVAENVKFIDAYEHGTKLTDPKLAAAADALRSMNDQLRKQIQDLGTGQLENFDENYLGRIWKDPETAGRDLYARRPLEGNKNFLKARTIPFYTDGLQWRAYDADNGFIKSFPTEDEAKAAAGDEGRVGEPLEPITTNPVEMALLKAKEMRKYVYGQRIFQEMKDADLARFVGFGQQALPGWVKIDDKIGRVLQPADGGGMILRGDYYAPDEAGTLLNNHLSPSALQGNSFFEGWRMLGNAVNAMQLGLSFFHVGFTSMDAIISKAALGMKQISRGDVGEGLGNVGMAMTGPVQSIANLIKGDKLLKAYNGGVDSPELSPLVQAIEQAGGRVKIDDFYRNEAVNTFRQALRNEQYGAAAKAFLPTVLDRVSAPIFEWLVPRQKLGVFADMANDWIAHNPDAGLAARREGLGKLWDSVDNRMGQLVYDNVFWNRTLKDGLMATVRSVGWNLGTFREIGGGVLDIKDIATNKGFSDRTAYIVALPLMAAAYGSVMHYLYNGSPPEDLKDAFYPRTGRTRPDGSPDRVSLPTYMKDVFAYGEDAKNFAKYGADPTQTLKNKAHPLIATVGQMLNNQDFFGGAIRNPADPAVQQVADEARFLIQQFEPFSYRNYIQQAKEKGEEPTALGYLTSPSMIGITPAPGYMTKTDEQLESAQVSRMREPLIMKYREAIKNGADPETLIPEMLKGGLSKADIKYVIKSSGETPKPARLKKFGADEPTS